MAKSEEETSREEQTTARRAFLTGSTLAMAGSLAASYGTLAVFAGRFLYPAEVQRKALLFVTEVSAMKVGDTKNFVDPTGAKIVIARIAEGSQTEDEDAEPEGEDEAYKPATDFVALSSTCPHLGCQVHWEPQNNRFFCPCHNGVFDAEGVATEGPPAQAGQSLAHYDLKVDRENVLLFIEVPVERLV